MIPFAKTADVPPGALKGGVVDGVPIVVANVGGEFRAFHDACPHMGTSLASGTLIGGVLMCRAHRWCFDAVTGEHRGLPPARATRYDVRVDGDTIWVSVSGPAARAPEADRSVNEPDWHFFAKRSEIPANGMKAGEIGRVPVVVVDVAGALYAVRDQCTHQFVKLSGGHVRGKVLTCPKHAWAYDVTTGEYLVNPLLKVRTYEVRVEGEDVLVRVPYEGYLA
jgi:nitrite reductase/ring-hydroxylating ferredoxin subunit